MTFVYLQIIGFSAWIILRVDRYPYGLLAMIVSLEAIFSSAFVMISQYRADAKRQIAADELSKTAQEEEEQQNRQLLGVSNQILGPTKAVGEYARLTLTNLLGAHGTPRRNGAT
jgi:uncharacterized membrane protein